MSDIGAGWFSRKRAIASSSTRMPAPRPRRSGIMLLEPRMMYDAAAAPTVAAAAQATHDAVADHATVAAAEKSTAAVTPNSGAAAAPVANVAQAPVASPSVAANGADSRTETSSRDASPT